MVKTKKRGRVFKGGSKDSAKKGGELRATMGAFKERAKFF